MTEQILLPINFGDMFISIFLDTSDIEVEEDSNIDESKNFNVDV